MKIIMNAIIGLALLSTSNGDDRPTIDSLIGVEVQIEDVFAGCAFTLSKNGEKYTALWEDFGSGMPVIWSKKFKVHVRSEYQFFFDLKRKGTTNRILVSLESQGEFKVYSDGLRIFVRK